MPDNSETSLCSIVESQFALDSGSIHGRWHWDRVWRFGMFIGEKNGADLSVVRLFAYLHDAKRETEGIDEGHGERAAEYVRELFEKEILKISEAQLIQLVFACQFHSHSDSQSDDITIKTCWDADRLDLPRVGIEVNPAMLFTGEAIEMLKS